MTAPSCATGCGRPSPSAAICGDCTASLLATLALAASIEADLLDAVARQLRRGHDGKSASTEAPLPYDPAASAARQALAMALADAIWRMGAWPVPDVTISGMAAWLSGHLADVASRPDAGDSYHVIRDAVQRAVMVLDGPPELHPAGTCECGAPLLAEPKADHATCRRCGMVTEGIAAARAARAAQADVLGDAEAISRALAGIGITVSGGTIRKWASRGRLSPRPGGAYAMSDVLAMVAERDARKAG